MLVLAFFVEWLRDVYFIGDWYWTASFFGVHTISVSICAVFFLSMYFNNYFVLEVRTVPLQLSNFLIVTTIPYLEILF